MPKDWGRTSSRGPVPAARPRGSTPWALGHCLLLALAFSACSDDEDPSCPPLSFVGGACTKTADCVDQGYESLTCLNGQCGLPCATESDCRVEPTCDDQFASQVPDAICFANRCIAPCVQGACPVGQVCQAGLCQSAFEGFEPPDGGGEPSFASLGWNQLPQMVLSNPTRRLVQQGAMSCFIGDDDCAGPAHSGRFFAVVGTQATSPKGSPTLDTTCQACACCLECWTAPERYSAGSGGCPFEASLPAPLFCSEQAPATCSSLCDQCDNCASAERTLGPNLLVCEQGPAQKDCSSCIDCSETDCRQCRDTSCSDACEDVDSFACLNCEQASCQDCVTCRSCGACLEADRCEISSPGTAACLRNRELCDSLGADGCYLASVGYERSELTPLEQSLVSPPFDASSYGELQLSFRYVPFSVGDTFFESQQGVPPDQWQQRAQALLVELCASNCGEESAWQIASLVDGQEARLPRGPGRRNNGLFLGNQSEGDWRIGLVEVTVPASLLTPTLRVRFRGQTDALGLFGIDSISWRGR